MSHKLKQGDRFDIQFVWKLPVGDFLRAVFEAEVLTHIPGSDRYLVKLLALKAGRQESSGGKMRTPDELDQTYWRLVGELRGRRAAVAVEAADGRPLHMILRTLTREHRFFVQFDSYEDKEVEGGTGRPSVVGGGAENPAP